MNDKQLNRLSDDCKASAESVWEMIRYGLETKSSDGKRIIDDRHFVGFVKGVVSCQLREIYFRGYADGLTEREKSGYGLENVHGDGI